jgi:hypothetical protein
MPPPGGLGSREFLRLPRRRQNEVIFSLLAPLARLDLEREVVMDQDSYSLKYLLSYLQSNAYFLTFLHTRWSVYVYAGGG